MSAYDALKLSNAWDPRFEIPTVPIHSNPHIYCAYAVRVLEAREERASANIIRQAYVPFLASCESIPGLITTWPGSGPSSHDDAYGAGFLNGDYAERAVNLVAQNDGVYALGENVNDETHNVYRFLFFIPAMRGWARADKERVGAFSQTCFALSLVFHLLFTKKGETSGHLLFWLSFPKMRTYSFLGRMIDYWCDTWTKRGVTPKSIFTNNYLTEASWFGDYASESWQ